MTVLPGSWPCNLEVAAKIIATSEIIILAVIIALVIRLLLLALLVVINSILQQHATDKTGTHTKSSTAHGAHAAALLRPLLLVGTAAIALLRIVSSLRRTIPAIPLLRRVASLRRISAVATTSVGLLLRRISTTIAGTRAAVLVLVAAPPTEQLPQQSAALGSIVARWQLGRIGGPSGLLRSRGAVHKVGGGAPRAGAVGAGAGVLLLLELSRELGISIELVGGGGAARGTGTLGSERVRLGIRGRGAFSRPVGGRRWAWWAAIVLGRPGCLGGLFPLGLFGIGVDIEPGSGRC